MKKWKNLGKCLLAVLLVMILGIQVFQGLNPTEVQATAVNAHTSTDGEVINGDFESGRDGYSVRSWSMTPTDANRKEEEASKWKNNFSLRTVTEQNGNKVAEFKKTGAGYMAMTSQEIAVTSLKDYRMSVDYKVQEITFDEAAAGVTTGVTPYRLVFYVEEISESNTSTYTYYVQTEYTQKVTPGWENFTTQFKTKVDTKKVVIYCWLGGEYRVNETVLFDNIELSAHDDYAIVNSSFDKLTYQAEGGRAEGTAGPAGWTLTGFTKESSDGTVVNDVFTPKWNNYFSVTTAQIDNRSAVAISNIETATSGGYILLQSSKIPVNGIKKCDIAADFKLTCYNADGTEALAEKLNRPGIYINLSCYDADGKFLGDVAGGKTEQTLNSDKTAFAWKKIQCNGVETVQGTAYVKVGFYLGFARKDMHKFVLYIDNVGMDVGNRIDTDPTSGAVTSTIADSSLGFTQYSCSSATTPRWDGSYEKHYGIRQINGGTGYEDAIQLYVTRQDGGIAGALFYTQPIEVDAGETYRVDFDVLVEGVSNIEKNMGADVVVRYKDSETTYLNNGKSHRTLLNDATNNSPNGWEHKSYNNIEVPSTAKYIEIGLYIGVSTSGGAGTNPDMKNSFANIAIAKTDDTAFWDKYADRAIDPEVTSSDLYKQSALFLGDSVGSALAEQAVAYSRMQVTNACSDTTMVTEQFTQYENDAYDYIVVSGGMKEKAASIPAGSVTADTIQMEGMDYDTSTFAGIMEQTFGIIAGDCVQSKVLYVLTTDDAAYRTVAQAAATKWGIELVLLENSQDAQKSWQDIIEPAEATDIFDCYKISGLPEFLSKKVEAIVGADLSIISDIAALQEIKEKALNCPDTYANYVGFQALGSRIDGLLQEFQDFRPSICGATIATDNPNALYFIGFAPKKALTEGVTVKAMGIISIPAEELDSNTELSLDNSKAKNMEVTYTEASQEFRACQEAWDADPYTEYTATAYVIYEVNGETYVFYSTNDYVNTLGTKTAEDGRCTKSIFGISQTVALQLLDVKEKEMDFAAIGGENNIPFIAQATEDSDVSLLDVYRLVGDNKAILKEWLDKGGEAK